MILSARRKRRELIVGHHNAALLGAQGNLGHCREEDSAIMSPILLTGVPV